MSEIEQLFNSLVTWPGEMAWSFATRRQLFPHNSPQRPRQHLQALFRLIACQRWVSVRTPSGGAIDHQTTTEHHNRRKPIAESTESCS